jgi:hypothetical protein
VEEREADTLQPKHTTVAAAARQDCVDLILIWFKLRWFGTDRASTALFIYSFKQK